MFSKNFKLKNMTKKNKEAVIKNVLIGTDPEMFLFSPTLNKFVPVCGKVGGTKDEPLKINDKGHAVQEDNVMVEYCIPPCNTAESFIEEINFVKNHINETILKPLGLVSKCVASARFDEADLNSEQAQMFGCDPDYSAYTLLPNEVNRTDMTLRTSGGHIHVGYDNPDPELSMKIIKAMDLHLGLASLILDTDTERRKMYGKAGAYRIKKYGVEYRVLSTFWTDNDALMKWAFDSTMAAVNFVNEGGIITNEEEIENAINNSSVDEALEILNDYNINIPEELLIKI